MKKQILKQIVAVNFVFLLAAFSAFVSAQTSNSSRKTAFEQAHTFVLEALQNEREGRFDKAVKNYK